MAFMTSVHKSFVSAWRAGTARSQVLATAFAKA
jgi:hypothetical protein